MLLLSSFGIVLSIILLFFDKENKGSGSLFLGLFLLTFNIFTLSQFIYIFSKSEALIAILLSTQVNVIIYLVGPLAYFYIRSVLNDNVIIKKADLFHFLFFVIFFLGILPFNFGAWEMKLATSKIVIDYTWGDLNDFSLNKFTWLKANYTLRLLHFVVYIILIWRLIISKNFFKISGSDNIIYSQLAIMKKWVLFFCIMITILAIFLALTIFLFFNTSEKSNFQVQGKVLFFLVFMVIILLHFGLIFFPQILYGIPLGKLNQRLVISNNNDTDSKVTPKLNVTLFHEEYINEIDDLLKKWSKELKFLDANSNINSLSNDIDIPLHHLNYFFNQVKDVKYVEWRNNLRIDYAVTLILNGEHKDKTIENIGKDCGFKTYSRFIQYFKLKMGVLPSDFIKNKMQLKGDSLPYFGESENLNN
jgi:AraC-like DNA-binding protein